MPKPVSLDALLREVDGLMFEWRACINTQTGEVASYGDSDFMLTGVEEDPDEEDYEGPEWLHVPFPDEDSDWRTMRDFASEQESDPARSGLWSALDGPRPFGTFRAVVRALGVEEAWFKYQREATRRLLRSWLQVGKVPFTEETPVSAE